MTEDAALLTKRDMGVNIELAIGRQWVASKQFLFLSLVVHRNRGIVY